MHEKAVLSVLLNYPESFYEVPSLCADHFYSTMREWFGIIRDEIESGNRASGEGLSLHAMLHAANRSGRLEAIGGPSVIAELSTYEILRTRLQSNVAILSEFRARRLAVTAGRRIMAAATTEELESLTDAISAPINAISDALTDSTPPKSTKEILKESIERFEKRAKGDETSQGVPTLELLDRYLHGAHPGRLWVVGAYPEGGKSVLASQIVLDAATNGNPCLFLSLEMSELDLMDRMIVQQARIDARAFTEPLSYARENGDDGVTNGLIQAIQRTIPAIGKSPLRIQRPANRNLPTIIAAIRKAHREIGIKIAAIDYMQLIRAGRHDNKEAEVSEISHALQEVAQDLGITLIVLSQLNADGDTKHGRVIEEDADAVILIVQDRDKESETYKQHRYVLIAKDRHYGSGGTRVPLILDRAKIRFVEGQDETNAGAKKRKPNFQR